MYKSVVSLSLFLMFSISAAQEYYGGIGVILIRQMNGCLMVYDLAPGGPAETSGLKRGDLMDEVNGMSVRKNTMKSVTDVLKGQIGTTVNINILRNNRKLSFHVTRKKVVSWKKAEPLAGDFKNGLSKQRGVNGHIYEAIFLDGQIYGPVRITKSNGELVKYNSYNGHIDLESIRIEYPDGSSYKGHIAEEVPNGNGVMVLPDHTERTGKWIYGQFVDGCYNGDCQDGKGVLIVEDNYKYSGEFKAGKIHGYGEIEYLNPEQEVLSFIGNYENNNIFSPGLIYYRNGNRYQGEFKRWYLLHGRGNMYYQNGDCYEGEWVDGKRTGFGVFITKNGDYYTGEFKDGKPGRFMASRVNGKLGYHLYKNGKIDILNEKYTNSDLKDVCSITDNEDLLFRLLILSTELRRANGPLYGDCENGNGISKLEHWKIYQGPFKNGLPHGQGKLFYGNENNHYRVYKGNFKEGKMHGQMIVHKQGEGIVEEAFYEGEHNWLWGSKTFAQLDTEKKEKESKEKEEYEAFMRKSRAEAKENSRRFNEQVEANKRVGSGSSNDDSWRKSSYDVCVSGDGENGHSYISFGNGDSYQGNMKDGLFHGYGQLNVKSSGKRYAGEFFAGQFHGSGMIYDKWGNRLKALFNHGKLISGEAYNPDGCHVYTAIYSNDVPSNYTYQSQSCTLCFGAQQEAPDDYNYGSGTGRSTLSQETIYYNKGTKDQWSIQVPVRTRR